MTSSREFVCQFCRKGFTTESRLLNHLCEPKRRFLQRDDKSVKLAFIAYQRFYERAMRRETTQAKFEASQFYTAFVRFARYLLDVNAINPTAFVDFLIRVEAPVDKWTQPKYYSRYIQELNKNESLLDAIERSFMVMEHWAVDSDADWHDFFRCLSPAKATLWLISGKISPWLLFTASSAADLFKRLNAEQMAMIEQAIDVTFWRAKLARHQAEVDEIRVMLTEHGI